MIIFSINVIAQVKQKPGDWETLKLTYTQPTPEKDFAAALPIGNGRLGAKIYGNVANEVIYLNEVTLWSGIPHSYNDPNSAKVLPLVRQAVAKGEYKKADSLARFMQGINNEAYQPLGDIKLNFSNSNNYTNYYRELDLNKAIVTIRYKVGEVTYTREIFASHLDEVIAMRIYSDKKGSINFNATMSTQLQGKTKLEGNMIIVNGRAPMHVDTYKKPQEIIWDEHKGIGFQSRLNIKTIGGKISSVADTSFAITNADTALLIFSSATSFNGIDKEPGTEGKIFEPTVKKYIADATAKSYQTLFNDHVNDYQNLFRRLWVEVNNEKPNKYVLAYQYARYNLIACSRPGGGAPRNEQGIWNRDIFPRYASNYTLNENPNKYYAVAEPGNIGEVTEPLIKYVSDLATNGTVTAKISYGFHGWVTHHNSDIWAMTTMATGDPCWANWPMGGIWLCENVWDRYAFNLDKNYLRQQAYSILKGAAEFALDLLVTNKKGYLVTSPSTSPENHFFDQKGNRVAVSEGTTMDMALLKELFQHCIAAENVLGIDADFKRRLQQTLPKLLPFKIGSQGQLNEWEFDYSDTLKEWEPNHRHASHLISVWPLSQINRNTPELLAATRKSLELRKTGGYHPDKAGMWARLLDGDKCLASLGINYPTAYDSPFGGFAEMLMQSQSGAIDILPALPSSWANGKISGMKARGNYEVDIEWADHQLIKATIRSYSGNTPAATLIGKAIDLKNDKRIVFSLVK
jgi:alpha-L-fucosidase 2